MKIRPRQTLVALTVGTLLGVMAAAHAGALPEQKQADGIAYITGGIGQSESHAMEAARKDWPLSLEFAVRAGKKSDFTADVKVAITHGGKPAFQAMADGPFMLVKLAPGKYDIAATHRGITQHRVVELKAGAPARVLFLWPEATDAPAK